MIKINDIDTLSFVLDRQLRRSVFTNTALSVADWAQELSFGPIEIFEWEQGLFIFRQRKGFRLLNFYLHPPFELPKTDLAGVTVTEITYRRNPDSISDLLSFFESMGFIEVLRRCRLVCGIDTGTCPNNAGFSDIHDIDKAYSLLLDSFDMYTGCLPSIERFKQDIEKKQVIVTKNEKGRIVSLLRFKKDKSGVQIRHLCTANDYKGKGYAQAAYDFLLSKAAGTITVWTGEDNIDALRFYEKNGFVKDNRFSRVYICKD